MYFSLVGRQPNTSGLWARGEVRSVLAGTDHPGAAHTGPLQTDKDREREREKHPFGLKVSADTP